MLDEASEHGVAVLRVAESSLVVVVDAGEDALERGVLLFERRARLVERLTDVGGRLLDGAPTRPVGHEKLVLVGVSPGHGPGRALGDELLRLLLEPVRQPLQEEQAEDVGLVVAAVDRPAQDVGRRPEVSLELFDAQRLGRRVGGLARRRGCRRSRTAAGAPRCRGRAEEPLDEVALLPAGIVETERSAQLLQTIPREFPQHLVEWSSPRSSQGVDELAPHAPVVDVQLVVVGIDAELVAGQLRKDGALRRHRCSVLCRSVRSAALVAAASRTRGLSLRCRPLVPDIKKLSLRLADSSPSLDGHGNRPTMRAAVLEESVRQSRGGPPHNQLPRHVVVAAVPFHFFPVLPAYRRLRDERTESRKHRPLDITRENLVDCFRFVDPRQGRQRPV